LTFRSASIAAVTVVVVGLMWVGHGLSTGLAGHGTGVPSGPAALAVMGPADGEPIRFGRDVRPILSDRCFLCHGPDRAKQQAGLRLDSFEAATAARPHGAAIVPGDPAASLAVRRLLTRDPDAVMPPPDSGKHARRSAPPSCDGSERALATSRTGRSRRRAP
jgi:hypothetical protein